MMDGLPCCALFFVAFFFVVVKDIPLQDKALSPDTLDVY